MSAVVVIVTGMPCTGKSALARQIAAACDLPLITKDGIKERLFDSLGWSDRAWSKRLSQASFSILYYLLEAELTAGRSVVVEANFTPQWDNPRFAELRTRYAFTPIQVELYASGEVLLQRFVTRSAGDERHPGHVDNQNITEFEQMLRQGRPGALDTGGTTLSIDTTDFSKLDLYALIQAIRLALTTAR